MSLGKRPRPAPMRRTTSMGLLPSGSDPDPDPKEEAYRQQNPHPKERKRAVEAAAAAAAAEEVKAAAEVVEAEFLRACGLCKRSLGPGKETFIYRGDAAFCSLECRAKQMHQDERKEKCLRKSVKPSPSPPAAGSEATSNSGTVAAA